MKKVFLDQYTKAAAESYADTEGEIGGFARGTARWDKAFEKYLHSAYGTMSVGRNPYGDGTATHKLLVQAHPEIFGSQGFVGKYGDSEAEKNAIKGRILSAAGQLSKLIAYYVADIKTSGQKGQEGAATENSEISSLQFPSRKSLESAGEVKSKEDYKNFEKHVVRSWITLDLIENAVLEYISPMLEMDPDDLKSVLNKLGADQATAKEVKGPKRAAFIKYIKDVFDRAKLPSFKSLFKS